MRILNLKRMLVHPWWLAWHWCRYYLHSQEENPTLEILIRNKLKEKKKKKRERRIFFFFFFSTEVGKVSNIRFINILKKECIKYFYISLWIRRKCMQWHVLIFCPETGQQICCWWSSIRFFEYFPFQCHSSNTDMIVKLLFLGVEALTLSTDKTARSTFWARMCI